MTYPFTFLLLDYNFFLEVPPGVNPGPSIIVHRSFTPPLRRWCSALSYSTLRLPETKTDRKWIKVDVLISILALSTVFEHQIHVKISEKFEKVKTVLLFIEISGGCLRFCVSVMVYVCFSFFLCSGVTVMPSCPFSSSFPPFHPVFLLLFFLPFFSSSLLLWFYSSFCQTGPLFRGLAFQLCVFFGPCDYHNFPQCPSLSLLSPPPLAHVSFTHDPALAAPVPGRRCVFDVQRGRVRFIMF